MQRMQGRKSLASPWRSGASLSRQSGRASLQVLSRLGWGEQVKVTLGRANVDIKTTQMCLESFRGKKFTLLLERQVCEA